MEANPDSSQERSPKLPSFHLRTFLAGPSRRDYIRALDPETRTFFVQHASRRKPRLAKYEFLRYLTVRWLDSFDGKQPTLESAFRSGMLQGAGALVRLAEQQAAEGHPEGVEGLKAVRGLHLCAIWDRLGEALDFNFVRWNAQYLLFQGPFADVLRYVGLDLTTEDGPNEASHQNALGVFTIIVALLMVAENPEMPLPKDEDAGEEVA